MYQRFRAYDISPIQNFGLSIHLGLLTLCSEIEISCTYIYTDIAKTVVRQS